MTNGYKIESRLEGKQKQKQKNKKKTKSRNG